MAIYKSSFNKKPEKKEKPEKVKRVKIKDEKPKKTFKINKSLVCLLCFLVVFVACVLPNNFFKSFILGSFGLLVYPVCIIGIIFSSLFLAKRKFKAKKRYMVYLTLALLDIWFIFHLILTSRLPMNSYGEFLGASYLAKTTAGGLIFSLVSWPITKVLTTVGAYIFSAIGLAIFVGLIIDYINTERTVGHAEKRAKFDFRNIEDFELNEVPEKQEYQEEKQRKIAKRRLGLEKGETTIISSNMPQIDVSKKQIETRPMSKREYILTPLEPIIPPESVSSDSFTNSQPSGVRNVNNSSTTYNDRFANAQFENSASEKPISLNEIEDQYSDIILADEDEFDTYNEIGSTSILDEPKIEDNNMAERNSKYAEEINYVNIFEDLDSSTENYEEIAEDEDLDVEEIVVEPLEETDNQMLEETMEEIVDDNSNYSEDLVEEITPNINTADFVDDLNERPNLGSTVETEVVRPSVDLSRFNLPNITKKTLVEEEQTKINEPKQKEEIPPYVAPPVELLNYIENVARISDEELQDNIDRLEQVLEDFKVPAKVNNVQVGPAVTRYELTMPRGISVNKIAQMSDDIAMTLASNGAIRVEAPIPGKNSVGIEVPNKQISSVSLRELIDSNDFRVRGNPLSFVLGKDINGDIMFCNLDKMPHVLVAGSTGSGKSVCLNTMLLSMCYKAGPQDLRLILVDPKMVEFNTYNGLPHLLIPEVITNKDMTINALDWCVAEMERRYALFAKNHVVNINEFNKLEMVKNKKEEKLPFIVVVVDELADLMSVAKREIEDRIARLAAKARAAGIHLVLATQRPSVDVITGTVKANLPSRIAFALTNYMDSKTVLDGGGAEKLLGKGDMLFKPQDKPEPRRIQGAFVSNAEITKVVEFIKENNKPVYDDNAGNAIKNANKNKSANMEQPGVKDQEFDPVLKEALRMFIQTKQASGSMISRRYSVGFNRAGRIMDQMERAGFIGPQEGSKPRTVLITMEEYNAIFADEEN